MERGKEVCKMLKEIRRQIALENDIVYVTTECKHKGNCPGTCPKCEAEVAYLEEQLAARKRLGKTNRVAGIAMGIAATLPIASTSCNTLEGDMQAPLEGDPIVPIDTIATADSIEQAKAAVAIQPPKGYVEGAIFVEISDDISFLENEGDEIYQFCEEMPEFLGGVKGLMSYLKKNTQYPVEARKTGKECRVIVRFIVEKDGSITNPEVIKKGADPQFEAEALRVVGSMPKWKPGKQGGEAVRCSFTIPVTFKLNK